MSNNSLVGSERHLVVVCAGGDWPKLRRQLQEALRNEVTAFHETIFLLEKKYSTRGPHNPEAP
jgi:hypothetical protein